MNSTLDDATEGDVVLPVERGFGEGEGERDGHAVGVDKRSDAWLPVPVVAELGWKN